MSFKKYVMIPAMACLVLASCSKTPVQVAETYQSHLAKISTIEEIQKECVEIEAERANIISASAPLLKKNPSFVIFGDVKDKGKSTILIWGKAFVGSRDQHWVSSGEERNILVINPKNQVKNENYYQGRDYFLKKDSGKNGFGADVPVWVFGDPPQEVAEVLAKNEEMNQKQAACFNRKLELESAQKEKTHNVQGQVQNVTGNSTQNQQAVAEPAGVTSAAATAVPPPENSCANPATDFDLRRCAREHFEKADQELNQIYKKVFAKLPPDQQVRLKREQIAWIRLKEKDCTAAVEGADKGTSVWELNSLGCQTTMTEKRITDLKAMES